ncbi:hypothetical protein HYX08_03645 [Candidatus Woesearchaeota archaeon]|nr:hypothetical protein [Candidatus Woesearchaeota archaeon]
MAYGLIIPPELVHDMFLIREKSGVSIRKQILQSIQRHVEEHKGLILR